VFDFIRKFFGTNKSNNLEKINIAITTQPSYTDEVQELLQLATFYKQNKEFDKACFTLLKAYELGGENIGIKDRLRLPMYMQLANQNDSGWSEIVTLFTIYLDATNQSIISNQIRIFLEKEKKFLPALPYAIYSHCKLIQQYRESISQKRYKILNDSHNQRLYQILEDDNQIYMDGRWEETRINNLIKYDEIELIILKSLKKAKLEIFSKSLASEIKNYIDNNSEYIFTEINDICKKLLLQNIRDKTH
jgi:hypothetical protein